MKTAVFSTKSYDQKFLEEANVQFRQPLTFFDVHLNADTAPLAEGFEAVCAFVNDSLQENVLEILKKKGVRLIALRCAGFNNVDLTAADRLGLTVMRVPAYSPHGVAEHTVALMLTLNRKIYRSFQRVREGNFSLEGLLGFEMYGKTVGVVGTGRIGAITAKILSGFGCRILAYDPRPSEECRKIGVKYVELDEIWSQSDIITLHTPLMRETHHIVNMNSLKKMKDGVMIINTSRGGLIDAASVIHFLKSGKIGHLGLDVYEEEGDLFFEDLSGQVIQDDVFARLLTFPNVIITGHQAFFTQTALKNIAETTLSNIEHFRDGKDVPENTVSLNHIH